jgi:hypothetical protein
MPRKMTTTQLELFLDIQSAPVTQTPPWQSLPGNTQQTLTRLMARLIADHVGAAGRENDHEA